LGGEWSPAWREALERENLARLEELLFLCISEARVEGPSLLLTFAVGNYSIFPMTLEELRGEVSVGGYIEKVRDHLGQLLERQSIHLLTRRYPLLPPPKTAEASRVEVRLRGRFRGAREVEKEFRLASPFFLAEEGG
jgi:hypothetical protein